jgi:hypothetical protein
MERFGIYKYKRCAAWDAYNTLLDTLHKNSKCINHTFIGQHSWFSNPFHHL